MCRTSMLELFTMFDSSVLFNQQSYKLGYKTRLMFLSKLFFRVWLIFQSFEILSKPIVFAKKLPWMPCIRHVKKAWFVDGHIHLWNFVVIPGNPLTCDCETLWLRNWASSERSAVEDEPICYFPSQLSGNPLRQLRTSRFTCGARSTQMIRDACRGIPVKTPAQQHIQVGLKSGMLFNPTQMFISSMMIEE